jgi:hypothetical protein
MAMKIEVTISFLSPGHDIALLKNIMISGVQITDKRQVRREWTERR